MDNAQPEDVDLGFDPLDVVEHVLNAENLDFDRTEDGDLAFALAKARRSLQHMAKCRKSILRPGVRVAGGGLGGLGCRGQGDGSQ